jgi:hypothetical protein
MAGSNSSYVNSLYKAEEGSAYPFDTSKLSSEVGRINDLDGYTGFTAAQDLKTKQEQSTTGGCGTSFTTATDPKDINIQQELSGNFLELSTINAEGDVQKKWIKADGSSITMAEDGSLIFTTAKRNGDPKTGRFDVAAQGKMTLKIGEAFLIEVGNKNEVLSSKEGDGKGSKAMSLVIYGNVDLTTYGDINAKAKNITMNADNEIQFKAGSKITIASGEGTGGNEKEGNKEAKKEYGGVVEIKTGDLSIEALSKREQSSMDYSLIDGEQASIVTKTNGNVGIQSPGSFTLDVAGDMYEVIGGKRRTDIFANTNPITDMFKGQSDGWLMQIGPMKASGSADETITPNALSISATVGGLSFNTLQGDIDLYSAKGYYGIGNATSAVVGVDTPVKAYPNATPGLHVFSTEKPVKVYSKASWVEIYATALEKSGIKIDVAKLELKNPTGIYLN